MSKEPTRKLFERFRRLYIQASEHPSDPTADNPQTNGIPFVMVGRMKAALRRLGHSDQAIARMKPEEGHEAINARLRELGLDEHSMTPDQKLAAILDHDSAEEDEEIF